MCMYYPRTEFPHPVHQSSWAKRSQRVTRSKARLGCANLTRACRQYFVVCTVVCTQASFRSWWPWCPHLMNTPCEWSRPQQTKEAGHSRGQRLNEDDRTIPRMYLTWLLLALHFRSQGSLLLARKRPHYPVKPTATVRAAVSSPTCLQVFAVRDYNLFWRDVLVFYVWWWLCWLMPMKGQQAFFTYYAILSSCLPDLKMLPQVMTCLIF